MDTTTDWIQAIAAIIASVGAVIGFLKLIKRDKDKENQINSLIELATESKKQTDIMIKQNANMEQQLINYREDLSFRYSTRASDIKPCFIELETKSSFTFHEITIYNVGKGSALRTRFEIIGSNSNYVQTDLKGKKFIKPNETITIKFPIIDETDYFFASLQFTDEDGLPYSQRLKYEKYKFTIILPHGELVHPKDEDEN
jgi:archaellum component FlaF (FlaF/FlaG flagellin family)